MWSFWARCDERKGWDGILLSIVGYLLGGLSLQKCVDLSKLVIGPLPRPKQCKDTCGSRWESVHRAVQQRQVLQVLQIADGYCASQANPLMHSHNRQSQGCSCAGSMVSNMSMRSSVGSSSQCISEMWCPFVLVMWMNALTQTWWQHNQRERERVYSVPASCGWLGGASPACQCITVSYCTISSVNSLSELGLHILQDQDLHPEPYDAASGALTTRIKPWVRGGSALAACQTCDHSYS